MGKGTEIALHNLIFVTVKGGCVDTQPQIEDKVPWIALIQGTYFVALATVPSTKCEKQITTGYVAEVEILNKDS